MGVQRVVAVIMVILLFAILYGIIQWIQSFTKQTNITCSGGIELNQSSICPAATNEKTMETIYCPGGWNVTLDSITNSSTEQTFWAILCDQKEGSFESITLFKDDNPILQFKGNLLSSFKLWLKYFISNTSGKGCKIFGSDFVQVCYSTDGWKLGSMQIIQPSVDISIIPLNNFVFTIFYWT